MCWLVIFGGTTAVCSSVNLLVMLWMIVAAKITNMTKYNLFYVKIAILNFKVNCTLLFKLFT